MTVREVNVFTGRIIDLVNQYNEARRVTLGLIEGNIDSAYDVSERVGIKIDTLTSVLKECGVNVIIRYDISCVIFKIDIRYHDTQKEYKANSKFRFMHK